MDEWQRLSDQLREQLIADLQNATAQKTASAARLAKWEQLRVPDAADQQEINEICAEMREIVQGLSNIESGLAAELAQLRVLDASADNMSEDERTELDILLTDQPVTGP